MMVTPNLRRDRLKSTQYHVTLLPRCGVSRSTFHYLVCQCTHNLRRVDKDGLLMEDYNSKKELGCKNYVSDLHVSRLAGSRFTDLTDDHRKYRGSDGSESLLPLQLTLCVENNVPVRTNQTG